MLIHFSYFPRNIPQFLICSHFFLNLRQGSLIPESRQKDWAKWIRVRTIRDSVKNGLCWKDCKFFDLDLDELGMTFKKIYMKKKSKKIEDIVFVFL